MVRLWWFLLGVGSGAWGTMWLMKRVQQARTAFAPANLARHGALAVADVLEVASERMGAH